MFISRYKNEKISPTSEKSKKFVRKDSSKAIDFFSKLALYCTEMPVDDYIHVGEITTQLSIQRYHRHTHLQVSRLVDVTLSGSHRQISLYFSPSTFQLLREAHLESLPSPLLLLFFPDNITPTI